MTQMDRYTAETMARHNFTDFVDTFMENQLELIISNEQLENKVAKLNAIEEVLPDNTRTLWWLTNLIKIIQLIIMIIKRP